MTPSDLNRDSTNIWHNPTVRAAHKTISAPAHITNPPNVVTFILFGYRAAPVHIRGWILNGYCSAISPVCAPGEFFVGSTTLKRFVNAHCPHNTSSPAAEKYRGSFTGIVCLRTTEWLVVNNNTTLDNSCRGSQGISPVYVSTFCLISCGSSSMVLFFFWVLQQNRRVAFLAAIRNLRTTCCTGSKLT